MDVDSRLKEIDQPYLTDLLRRALGSQALEVGDWEIHPLHGGMERTSVVFRLRGQAEEAGQTIPWSLVLKAVGFKPENDDPQGIWYWKREALAYESGLLHRLPGKVTAPRCYAVREQPDDSVWLWLEDLEDEIGSPWPLEHYGVVARHLGQFNGAYLVGQPLPGEPWITRNWLQRYVEHAAPMIAFIRSNLDHPIVQKLYPGNSVAQIMAFWEERGRILDALDRLPQVFCHQDAFKRNLFARRDQTVAIDWGYMGIAPLGAELVALVGGSLGLYEVPASQAAELDRICFEGYIRGLRDAGWDGDPRLVRLGYTVTCLLRYIIGGNIGQVLPSLLDEDRRSELETAIGRPSEEIEQADQDIVAYYQSLVLEALKLLGVRRVLGILGRIAGFSISLRRGSR